MLRVPGLVSSCAKSWTCKELVHHACPAQALWSPLEPVLRRPPCRPRRVSSACDAREASVLKALPPVPPLELEGACRRSSLWQVL